MDLEDCPICYRTFAQAVIPICLACGHSCCNDCLGVIRSCPLCRHKIASSFPKKPNYSLLAMISRSSRTTRTHQETQTDLNQPAQPSSTTSSRRQTPQAAFLEGKSMTLAFKKSAIELRIK